MKWRHMLGECSGANTKLTYWDCHTGEAIRELEASEAGPVLCVAVHRNGSILASGGADKQIRLWRYSEGTCFAVGRQHTGDVIQCIFTADGQRLISADSHGVLCIWDITDAVQHAGNDQNSTKSAS
jgi:WD40 repeat protein